jgi:hypothetical protein
MFHRAHACGAEDARKSFAAIVVVVDNMHICDQLARLEIHAGFSRSI